MISRGDEYLSYPKCDGLPTVAGVYWHRLEKHLSGPAYSVLTTVEIHPQGYPFCNGGRMDQMPGEWYGPVTPSEAEPHVDG